MNFDLPPPKEKRDWTYRCRSCEREFVYVWEMPEHLLTDIDPVAAPDGGYLRRCGGRLELVRSEPRK